jgi:serine/threonine-protein kinase
MNQVYRLPASSRIRAVDSTLHGYEILARVLPKIRDQYEAEEEIGSGGMGKVYRARDTKLNRLVALKVLLGQHRADPALRKRFLQEAQAASSLNHPNIITIYDIVSEDDSDVMVMEYLSGRTLAESIPPGGMRARAVIAFGYQIADALATAHAAGIIHRDLKPGNIMVTGKDRIKVLDFGLAKLSRPAPADSEATRTAPLTMQGTIMGTVSYMSPEQAQGMEVDARSDVFSFGAVLYEMATGNRAFKGHNNLSTLTSVLRDEPAPILACSPDIPEALERVIMKCLRKDLAQRTQSMEEVRAALGELRRLEAADTLAPGSVSAIRPPSAPPPAPTQAPPPPVAASKSKVAPIALIGLGVAVLGGLGWLLTRAPSTPADSPAKQVSTTTAPLTNNSVLEMARAKVPDADIIRAIRSGPTNFDTSPTEVVRLIKGGVSATVVDAMRPAGAAKPAPSPVETKPAAPVVLRTVTVPNGTPVSLRITEEIEAKVEPGTDLRFVVQADVKVGKDVVIAKGAVAKGTVLDRTKKRFLVLGSKVRYELNEVAGVGGATLKLRAVPAPNGADASRPLEVQGPKPKNVLAPKGAEFVGYLDGDGQVTLR